MAANDGIIRYARIYMLLIDQELVNEANAGGEVAAEWPSALLRARVESLPSLLESQYIKDLGGITLDIDRGIARGDSAGLVQMALTCLVWRGTAQDEPGLKGDLVQIQPRAAATFHGVLLDKLRSDPDQRAWNAYQAAAEHVQGWDPVRARDLVQQEWRATQERLDFGVQRGLVTSRTPAVLAGEETNKLLTSGRERVTALGAPAQPETTPRSGWRALINRHR